MIENSDKPGEFIQRIPNSDGAVLRLPPKIDVEIEMGRWTIRINGDFIMDFPRWREGKARRVTMALTNALIGYMP